MEVHTKIPRHCCNHVRDALHEYAQEVDASTLEDKAKTEHIENARRFHEWLIGRYFPGVTGKTGVIRTEAVPFSRPVSWVRARPTRGWISRSLGATPPSSHGTLPGQDFRCRTCPRSR